MDCSKTKWLASTGQLTGHVYGFLEVVEMVQEMVKRVLDLQDILEVIGEFSKVRDEFLKTYKKAVVVI